MQIFALSLVPVMAITGGFVDYNRASRARAQLAATVDAAVLAAQLQYSQDDDVDYDQIIRDYVAKNLTEATKAYELQNVSVGTATVSEEMEMSVHVSAEVKMPFLSLVGLDKIDIDVASAAKVGGSAVEVALVLDNTGSMSWGGKIGALKDAATELVEAIMVKPDDPKIKFALVPFADYVRLDMAERNETGLDIPANYSVARSWTDNNEWAWENCEVIPHEYDCGTDGNPQTCTWNEYTNCTQVANSNWGHTSSWDDNYAWHGCMGSRPHDLNTRDEDYGTQGAPGIMSTSDNVCNHVQPLTRLTSKRADIISGINTMPAAGWTYIPSGLMWGWRVLSPEAPFTDAVDYDDKGVRKVIVLMTDGANTRSTSQMIGDAVTQHAVDQVYNHSGGDITDANEITSELCTNIKAKDIMIYTIAFDVEDGSPIKTLLQDCAGNGGQYYDAENNTQLADAFRQIGLALLNLRLSK